MDWFLYDIGFRHESVKTGHFVFRTILKFFFRNLLALFISNIVGKVILSISISKNKI